MRLSPSRAPQLPVAPTQYGQQERDKYSNVLRLYFNQLTNAFSLLFNTKGGANLNFPYGSFHQDGTTTLSVGISNTSTTAISVASTFTNLIVGQSINLLEEAGVAKPRNLLAGILRSTLEESLRSSVTEIDPADLLDGDVE